MKKYTKIFIFIMIVAVMLILNHYFKWSAYLMDADNYIILQELVGENLLLAMLLYIGITVLACVLLAMPGVTFAIAASFLFGPYLGTICCVIAVSIGAGIAFLAGRYFLKDGLKPTIENHPYLHKILFEEAKKNDMVVLMITRLVPVFPFNLQNFAYGITDISFRNYMLYSFLFMIPGTAMYTIGMAGVLDTENRVLYFTITAIISIGVIALGRLLKVKYIKEEIKEEYI